MYKKYFILIIPLIALIAIGIHSGNVYSFGHFKAQSGIGGTVEECNICHDFANGYYESPPVGFNLRWVKTAITFCSTSTNIACDTDTDCPEGETCGPLSRTVKFTASEDTTPPFDGTLADGNTSLLDGACEVCHTQLGHHNNNPSGDHEHYKGQNCTTCHPHFADDITEYFIPVFAGGQAHETHIGKYVGGIHLDDPKGPMIGENNCTYNLGGCHYPGNFSLFGQEAAPLSTTTVCNPCHSNNGAFDGVNDSVIGAKPNWVDAIYKEPLNPGDWPSEIQDGKHNWCAGCHDDVPANSKKDGSGIKAPKVMGDNVKFGYNVTGHGIYNDPPITCAGPLPFGCHATISKFCSTNKSRVCIDDTDCPTGQTCNYVSHIDGNEQTYAVSQDNYRSGYRLAEDMSVPRLGQYGASAFKLCFRCHDSIPFLVASSTATDFRSDIKPNPETGLTPWNFHWEHLKESYNAPNKRAWDSDYDWPGGACSIYYECSDSAMSCTACHNVHGSPCIVGTSIVTCTDPVKNPMIRHGELISTDTMDRTPAFQFHWYNQTSAPVTDWESSKTGGLRCGEAFYIDYNHVCWGCHGRGERQYYRSPGGPNGITITSVLATDYIDNVPNPDEFSKGSEIRYHVKFKSKGPAASYCVKAIGRVRDSTGTLRQSFNKSEVLSSSNDIREWTWDKTVLSTAATGTAKVTITVNMYNAVLCPLPTGTPTYTEKETDTFGIIP